MTIPYIFLYLFLFKILPISSNQEATCSPSKKVINELNNRYSVNIVNPNIHITYNLKSLQANTINESKMKLLIKTSNIIFTGRIESKKSKNVLVNKRITVTTKPIVIQRIKKSLKDRIEKICSMSTSENVELNIGLSVEIEAALIQIIEFCIKDHICEQFDTLISNKLVKKHRNKLFSFFHSLKESFKFSKKKKSIKSATSHLISKKKIIDSKCEKTNMIDPQPTINAMVDFGIGQLTKHFFKGIIKIPDIKSNFSTSILLWKVSGYFHASKGSFRNITDLRRINDVVFTNENLRFEMSSTLGIQTALLKFEDYEVKYGKIKIRGLVTVNINEIIVSSKVAVDFNRIPCKTYLMFFKIHDLGKINVVMTGLGALNYKAASVVSWIIKTKTFGAIKAGVDKNLSKFNCEKFRL